MLNNHSRHFVLYNSNILCLCKYIALLLAESQARVGRWTGRGRPHTFLFPILLTMSRPPRKRRKVISRAPIASTLGLQPGLGTTMSLDLDDLDTPTGYFPFDDVETPQDMFGRVIQSHIGSRGRILVQESSLGIPGPSGSRGVVALPSGMLTFDDLDHDDLLDGGGGLGDDPYENPLPDPHAGAEPEDRFDGDQWEGQVDLDDMEDALQDLLLSFARAPDQDEDEEVLIAATGEAKVSSI